MGHAISEEIRSESNPKSEYFYCDRLNCSLVRSACGKRWLMAAAIITGKKHGISKGDQAYMSCRKCDEGKVHSKLATISAKTNKNLTLVPKRTK